MPVAWDEERTFIAASAHRLRGALALPRARRSHPAVLLLPSLGGHSRTAPLREARANDGVASLLRAWAEAGLAVLRVDPCGVGESGGPAYAETSLDLEVSGYRACLAWLASHPFVDPAALFLLGHSLGGALAPLVASAARLAGVLVYGAPSRRWSRCLADTARRQLALGGAPEEIGAREGRLAARLFELIMSERQSPAAAFGAHPALALCRAAADLSDDRLHGRALDYFRALDDVDPEVAWRHVGAPVLAVHGEHDWIVADDDHLRIAGWAAGGEHGGTPLTLPELDHDLLRHESRAASFANRGRGAPGPGAAAETLAWMRARIAHVGLTRGVATTMRRARRATSSPGAIADAVRGRYSRRGAHMTSLSPCPTCRRHVRAGERCPFCGAEAGPAEISATSTPEIAGALPSNPRLRAVVLAASTALAGGAALDCGGNTTVDSTGTTGGGGASTTHASNSASASGGTGGDTSTTASSASSASSSSGFAPPYGAPPV